MPNDNGGSEQSEAGGNRASDPGPGTGASFDRRTFLRTVGAGSVAVSLAGCSGDGDGGDGDGDGDGDGGGDGGGGDGGGATTTAGGDGGDATTTTAGGDSGTTTGGGGGSDLPDTLQIGALAPVPSENPIGASIVGGAKLAASQLNNDGEVLPDTTVEILTKDTKEKPSVGRTKYRELVRGKQVHATTGIFTSEVLLAIMDSLKRNRTIHLGSGAATPEANTLVRDDYESYKYFFRAGPVNSFHLGTNMVDFLKMEAEELGWDSVGVLVEDFKWTSPVQRALDERMGSTDVQIMLNKRYASGTQDFSSLYDDIQSSGADAAYVAMAHTGTPAMVQWAKQQRPFAFGGIHVPAQLPAYFQLTKGACSYSVIQNVATPQAKVTTKTIPFANAYMEQFDRAPVYTGYITFDAVMQYAQRVHEEGTTDEDSLVTALENQVFTGTSGTLEYYPSDHEFAHDPVYGEDRAWPLYMQWQPKEDGGAQEVLHPDGIQTASFKSPPWV